MLMQALRRRTRHHLLSTVLVLALATGTQLGLVAAGPAAAAGAAPDGPGALSHFDRARKDCLGTARNRTSKVWFTVANGVLSDVYYPTVDNTNVETLQYLVTDGATFTDLQTRDTTYTVEPLDPSGTSDSSGGHPVPVASDPVTATNASNRDYAQPVFTALDASTPFTQVSNGFAGGASDGLTQLDTDHALTTTYSDAVKGNLVQTAAVGSGAEHGLTLSLGFGASQDEAVHTAGAPNNTYFVSYREVFSRYLYDTFTGLLTAGDRATARDTVRFLFERQQLADGSMPRNSLVNGKPAPDTFGTQLDEVTYPILMALQVGLTDKAFYTAHIKPAANFAISHGPSFGSERWEEQGGFSPSTIAAEIAGLIAAADIASSNGDPASARVWRGVADDFQRSVKGWTVTSNGPKSSDPYFIRLSKNGDPNEAVSYNVGNGGPTLDQREVIDAGFLELPRLGMFPASDPDVLRSLPVVDATLRRDTNSGPGWLRYNGDGYGDGSADGHPWAPSGKGNGHLWPVLAGERAEHQIALGDRAAAAGLADAMRRFASGVGLIPEQGWENPDLAPSPFGTDP